jgi:hypothetical protein
MTLALTYMMTFENSEGALLETEIGVGYKSKHDLKIGELDEMARRYIIGKIINKGGRVIRLERINVETS